MAARVLQNAPSECTLSGGWRRFMPRVPNARRRRFWKRGPMRKMPQVEKPSAHGRECSQQSLIGQYGPGIAQSFRRISLVEIFPNLRSFRKRVPGQLHKLSVAVFDEYLASGGWYVTIADGVYDMVYPNLPRTFAELKHAAILQEIERQIRDRFGRIPTKSGTPLSHELGRLDFEALRNGPRQTVVLNLDIADILPGTPGNDKALAKRITRTVRDVLDELLAINGYFTRLPPTQILLIFPEISRPLAQLKRDTIANEITRRLAATDEKGRKRPAAGEQATRPPSRNLVFRTKPSASLVNAWNQAAAEARGPFDPDEARAMPAGWTWTYQPLWRVRNRLLTAYVLCGFAPAADEYSAIAKDSPLKEVLIRTDQPGPVDLPLLDIAVRDLHRMASQGRQAVVIVPVRFATLDRTNLRTLYLHLCSQVPEEARKYLVPEIVGVPPDLVGFRLEERINQLRPFSRAILIRASLTDQRFRQWGNLGLHAVGIDMSQYLGSEADIMQGLDQFADAAENAKLHTYAYSIPSLSLTTATVASGIDYAGGDLIAPPTRQPLAVTEFDMEMLYPGNPSPAADGDPRRNP
jgi:hypothetical protein